MNTLIVPGSGQISFSQFLVGSSELPPLSSSARIAYTPGGGLTIVSTASSLDRFSVEGLYGNLLTVNDTATGVLFKLSDMSGFPKFSVDDSGNTSTAGILSSRNAVYASGGNSNEWNSAYTTTKDNSATWSGAYTNLVNNSAAYLSGFDAFDLTAIATTSGSWNSAYTTTKDNSATWSEAYTNLVNNSAAYLSGFDAFDLTAIATTSGSWNSNYTTTNLNSASWSGAYTSFNANSSFYDAAVNELFTYVISETGDEFITEDTLLMVDSNIAGYPAWNSTTETVVSLSAEWQNTTNIVANNASNWTSTYTTVCANSASWSSAYTTTNTNSASWSSAYTTLCSTSAFRISNTITSILFPNGYIFSSSDTGKTYHVDTRSTPVSVILPTILPNDFSVTLVALGTNNMHVSSSQVPMLCATGTRVNLAFASTFIYKYDNLVWGLGSLI